MAGPTKKELQERVEQLESESATAHKAAYNAIQIAERYKSALRAILHAGLAETRDIARRALEE